MGKGSTVKCRVSKLWPQASFQPTTCFCKQNLLKPSHVHLCTECLYLLYCFATNARIAELQQRPSGALRKYLLTPEAVDMRLDLCVTSGSS